MEGVFQRFSLDEKSINQILEEQHQGKSMLKVLTQGSANTLIKKLQEKGHIVLWSLSQLNGLPISIIAGGESPNCNSIKEDFQEITKNLGINGWFAPDHSYLSTNAVKFI